jgi:glycosidase
MLSPALMRFKKCIFILSLVISTASSVAQPPKVEKIDPPNWFIGLPSPMLLVKGENLQNAKITVSASGVRVTRVQGQRTAVSSDAGHYLFIWLDIAANTKPANIPIKISTPDGSSELTLPITKRRPLSDGFRGFDGNDVIYLIMPDRFADGDLTNDPPPQSPNTYDRNAPRAYHGGDLRGIVQHLDYLKELGITTIWVTPIEANDSAGRDYHGYGAVDLYAVDPHLGDLEEYRRLVTAAHQRGLKVLLDMVPNHVGPANPWVDDPPDLGWFHGTRQHHLAAEGNFAPITDPHSFFPEWQDVTEGWFANILPDMNTENPLTKQYLIQNAMWWAEEGAVDGFRLDTFPYVGRGFWQDFHAALHNAYPAFKTVGECFNPDPTIVSYFAGGAVRDGIDTGLDTPFDFPVFSTLREVVINNVSIRRLADALRMDRLYPHPDRLVPFEGNHDVVRFLTAAKGDRRKLRVAFGILFTIRGTPQLYYGDEIGMEGNEDPDNRRDFPGGFPNDSRNAFDESGRTPEQQEIFSYVQSLLRLRAEHPALRTGDLKLIYLDDSAYVYRRELASDHLLVAVNNSDNSHKIALPSFFKATLLPISETTSQPQLVTDGVHLELQPRSVAIYLVR